MALQYTIYLGTYSGPQSHGIYQCHLDSESGQLTIPELVAPVQDPNFLALSPDGRFLYAVHEQEGSMVRAWSVEPDGKLTLLNHQPSGGEGACHLCVDAAGTNVLVAHYGSGCLASFQLKNDGSIGECRAHIQHTGSGPNPWRQESPHVHAVYTDATNTFVYACDLGTDEVRIYRLDNAQGTLAPSDPPQGKVPVGAGPRHLALHPRGFAYANNEMGLSVTVFQRDAATGALKEIDTVPTLSEETPKDGISTAEIFIHPNGKWLYVSNRGHNSIAMYKIGEDGRLDGLEHTPTPAEPRGFGISPDGEWLVVGGQKDNTLAAFKIDLATGELEAKGHTVDIGSPVCVVFAPPSV